MTKQDIASLALKLAGIFCFIRAIEHMHIVFNTVVPSFYNETMPTVYMMGSFFTLAGLLIAGILLIVLSTRLSKYIIGPSAGENITSQLTMEDIQRVAFSIIGVFFMVLALSNIHSILFDIYHISPYQTNHPSLNRYYERLMRDGLTFFLEFGLGFYLFFLGNGLVKLWQRYQPMRDDS